MRLRGGVGIVVGMVVAVAVVSVVAIRLRLDEDLSSYKDVLESEGLRRFVLSACGAIEMLVYMWTCEQLHTCRMHTPSRNTRIVNKARLSKTRSECARIRSIRIKQTHKSVASQCLEQRGTMVSILQNIATNTRSSYTSRQRSKRNQPLWKETGSPRVLLFWS
jgi:hypothetical protein